MKARTTRTLNPLPFQDLEPHRFEDMVRQLAYDFRKWSRLEATGRSGDDEGQDIRGIEVVEVDSELAEDGEETIIAPPIERLWIFQCKREKAIGPKRLVGIVNEVLPMASAMPYGFVVVAACDISKAARDAFRIEMVKRRIEEYAIWAKGELEDMLVLPKNDRLLFAYFNISLEPRRRTLATTLRAQISIKKQLLAEFDKRPDPILRGNYLLLRDPTDEAYPPVEDEKIKAKPSYIHCRYLDLDEPHCLTVLIKAHPAWTTPDRKHWDALYTVDLEIGRKTLLRPRPVRQQSTQDPGLLFLNEYAPREDQCELWIVGYVPLERVLAVDRDGDRYFRMPHIFVQFIGEYGPFMSAPLRILVRSGEPMEMHESATPKQLFPDPIPSLPYPVPRELDHAAISTASSLSDALVGEFTKIIADMRRRPIEDAGRRDWDKERGEKLQKFINWRDSIAVPTFAKFIRALREAGEEGRIATRSVSPSDAGHEAAESVELHICIRGYLPAQPAAWTRGRICATFAPPQEFSLISCPEPANSSQHAKCPKMEECTPERLEAEVLSLLRSLVGSCSQRFWY